MLVQIRDDVWIELDSVVRIETFGPSPPDYGNKWKIKCTTRDGAVFDLQEGRGTSEELQAAALAWAARVNEAKMDAERPMMVWSQKPIDPKTAAAWNEAYEQYVKDLEFKSEMRCKLFSEIMNKNDDWEQKMKEMGFRG